MPSTIWKFFPENFQNFDIAPQALKRFSPLISMTMNSSSYWLAGRLSEIGMPYLKLEGKLTDAVRLLDIWDEDEDGYVNVKIQDFKTHKVNSLSWILQMI